MILLNIIIKHFLKSQMEKYSEKYITCKLTEGSWPIRNWLLIYHEM